MKLRRIAIDRRIYLASAFLSCTVAFASTKTTPAVDEWRFNVSLDGKPIGQHFYRVSRFGSMRELISEARFNVRFLFLSAYRYFHSDKESWNAECVDSISAQTDDNGNRTDLDGRRSDSGFHLTTGKHSSSLSPCVMTFAYWNPAILEATQLLNPQTGEYVSVQIKALGTETISIRGLLQSARRYRIEGNALAGGQLNIEIWYSLDNRWVALQSMTDGRRLRYDLQ